MTNTSPSLCCVCIVHEVLLFWVMDWHVALNSGGELEDGLSASDMACAGVSMFDTNGLQFLKSNRDYRL